MSRRVLALMLCLAAGPLVGCGVGRSAPPPVISDPAPPHWAVPPADRPPSPVATPEPANAGDALEYHLGGMAGHTDVRWDPKSSRLFYESDDRLRGSPEKWDRRPSPEEWARFWAAMDTLSVWGWKRDYGGEDATMTDCPQWWLHLQHGGRSMRSVGSCGFPERGNFERVMEELTRLRGDAAAAGADGALALAERLSHSADWDDRIRMVRELGAMRPAPAAAVSALVDLLGAPPSSQPMAAPGREPIAAARAVHPLLTLALSVEGAGDWDKAIALYDKVLVRDPQNEQGARRRARAIEMRNLRRRQAAGQEPSPSTGTPPEETARQQAVLTAAAEDALVSIGEPAVSALIQALKDKNPHRARRAAKVLGQIPAGASSAAPALARVLRDPAIRNAAALALMRIAPQDSERYLPVLISGLDAPDADVARISAAALAELGTPAVLPALIHALADDRTHSIAMTGLGRMGPAAASTIPALLETLRWDLRDSEQAAAVDALKAMGAATVVPVLADVLRNDKDGLMRDVTVRTLGRLGPAASAAVPALIDTFRYGQSLASNAAEALGQIGAPAVPALTAALKCDRLAPASPPSWPWPWQAEYPETVYVRIYAAYALSRVGAPAKAAIPSLREALSDASPRVREAASGALRTLERR